MVAEYNSTLMTGGDSLTEDLNIYYEVRNPHSRPAKKEARTNISNPPSSFGSTELKADIHGPVLVW